MSNVALFNSNKLPAYLKKVEMDDATKALMGSGGYGRRISIRGGRFRMMLNGEQAAVAKSDTLDIVIVGAAPHVSRTYYGGEYDPDNSEAPTCWSSDGEKPDASVKSPCGKTCATCPMNVKGSGKGDSKACRYSQRIAVVLADDIEGDVYQLSVSALSLFGKGKPGSWPLQAYVKMVAGKGVPVTALVTQMEFDEDASVPVINFKPVRFLEPEEHEIILGQCESEDTQRAIEQTVVQTDGDVPVAAEAEDEEEEAPAPKKRAAKKPAPAKTAEPEEEDAEEDAEEDEEEDEEEVPAPKRTTRKAPAKKASPKPAPEPEEDEEEVEDEVEEEEEAPAPKKRAAKKAAPVPEEGDEDSDFDDILAAWDDED